MVEKDKLTVWDWVYLELRYWYWKLLFRLKLADEYYLLRPYHVRRMLNDNIKPLFPEGHETNKG